MDVTPLASPSLPAALWIPALLLGIGLAASSGLRTFLPLLLLSAAIKFHFLPSQLAPTFAWLGTDLALAALGIATVVETLGDKVPAIDHALDAVGTVSRPLAGALAAASVLNTGDPTTSVILGLVVGAPLALGVHTAKAGTRGASTATTMGLGNPVISVLEDVAALFLSGIALFVPLLVPLLLLLLGLILWKLVKAARSAKRKWSGHHAG
jgi:hypothetical protein